MKASLTQCFCGTQSILAHHNIMLKLILWPHLFNFREKFHDRYLVSHKSFSPKPSQSSRVDPRLQWKRIRWKVQAFRQTPPPKTKADRSASLSPPRSRQSWLGNQSSESLAWTKAPLGIVSVLGWGVWNWIVTFKEANLEIKLKYYLKAVSCLCPRRLYFL